MPHNPSKKLPTSSVAPRQHYARVGSEVQRRMNWLQLTELTYGKVVPTLTTPPTESKEEEEEEEEDSLIHRSTATSGSDDHSKVKEKEASTLDGVAPKSVGRLRSASGRRWVDATSCRKYEAVQRTTFRGEAMGSGGGRGEEEGEAEPLQKISAVDICCLIHKCAAGATSAKKTGNNGTCKGTTKEPYLLIVSQYRPAIDAFCLEMPAGLYDATDGSAAAAAARELYEETGYVADPMVLRKEFMKEGEESTAPEIGAESGQQAKKTNFESTLARNCGSAGPLSYDAGLSDDLFQLITFNIDVTTDSDEDDEKEAESAPSKQSAEERLSREARRRNRRPVQHLDDNEDIAVHLLPLAGGRGVGGIEVGTRDAETSSGGGADDEALQQQLRRLQCPLQRLEVLRRAVGPRAIVDGKLHSFIAGIAMAQRFRTTV